MRLRVVAENGEEVRDPYELRLPGWTEERYFEEAPEQGFCEFKDGELIVHSPVNIEHQGVVRFLTTLLTMFTSARGLGEVYNGPGVLRVRVNLDREPDIFFVAEEHQANVAYEHVEAPVGFVIEVLCESGRARDLKEKPAEYAEAGVAEYWVVDLDHREVVVHRLAQGRYRVEHVGEGRLDASAVPGFWIRAEWLWQRPMPREFDCLREVMGEI